MKKIFTAFALSTLASFAFAQTPDAVLRTSAPRAFFAKASELVRKIYPDPKFEMQMSFAMLPFGYPEFNGVSQTENAVICLFDVNAAPTIVYAVKADAKSACALLAERAKSPTVRRGEWLIGAIAAGDQPANAEKFADAVFQETLKHSPQIADLSLNDSAILEAAKNFKIDAIDDIEEIRASLDDDGTRLILHITIKARKNSPTAVAINKTARVREAFEAAFVPSDAEFTAICKMRFSPEIGALREQAMKSVLPAEYVKKYEEISAKNDGTFALVSDLAAAQPSVTSVAATAAAPLEFEKFALENSEISAGGGKIENRKISIGSTDAVKTTVASAPPRVSYSAIVGGYCLTSTDAEQFERAAKLIKGSAQTSDYPLKKYARADADFIAILNNKSVLRSLLKNMGAAIREDAKIGDTTATVSVAFDKIDILISADIDSVNFYTDIYRSSQKQK